MITIQSGKLTIPEEDRFVGFAGDNLGNSKTFVLPDHGADSGCYTLCLRFDDDSVRAIPLTKSLSGSDLVLTWSIKKSHLLKAGVVMAQLKYVGSDDVILHTSRDYFIIANSAELSDDGSPEYIVREELEERLSSLFDEDSAIRTYFDDALDGKVDKTTTIANLPLSSRIRASDLTENLSAYINPSTVQPGVTNGYNGQFGKTYDGKPVMCSGTSEWIPLATAAGLSSKMALSPQLSSISDVDGLPTGQLFTCQGGVGLKTENNYLELAKSGSVYTKAEIDAMIGNIQTLLSNI